MNQAKGDLKKNFAGAPTLRIIFLLILQLTMLVYYAWLRVDNARLVHEPRVFGDTADYFHNAGLSVFSREFWTDARPPVTALFWKAVNSDPEKIFELQLYFSIAAWAILAFTTAYAIRSYLLKPLTFALILAFSLSRDIFMWDAFLGSESIALSLTALFLASAGWLLMGWRTFKAATLIVLSVLMVFTRDTYAYFFLMSGLVILPVFWFSLYRVKAAGVSLAFLFIFLLSSQLAVLGLRPFRAVLMNTSLRIFPSETYTEYFRQHGMPIDENLVTKSRDKTEGQKFDVNKAFMFDGEQAGFRKWALESGSSEYIKFLWFYKADTFQNVFTETAGPSFYPDVYYYTATGYKPILKDARISELLYPTRFGLVFFFVANIVAAFIAAFAWRDRRVLWLLPLLMILLTYPQAVLVWAADVNDVARHSIPHNVLLRLGVWMLAFFVFDSLLADLSEQSTFLRRLRSLA
jgi:hypothetical protein